jgi:8-oxo-dGTP pyrophosphatase MutT (NUDIX family)
MLAAAARKRLRQHWQRLFCARKCHLQVAALPWRKGAEGVEVMLITSRGTGRWVLPKGWPEGEEQLCEAAAREAAEEAGLGGVVAPQALGSYHYDKLRRSGETLYCEVKVFPLEVADVAEKWRERRQRQRAWMRPEEAATKVHEPELAAILAAFAEAMQHRAAA